MQFFLETNQKVQAGMQSELEHQINNLKQGDHICLIHENAAEQLATVVPFIKDGLARGERCLYILDERTREEIGQGLAAAGIDVAQEQCRNALRFMTKEDSYFEAGEFTPQGMLEFVRREEAKAVAEGFTGFRSTGEMTSVLGLESDFAQLFEYEALLNDLARNSRSTLLCQYNRRRFDAPCIHDVLRTHPWAIVGERVCANPYYESPSMVLDQDQMVGSPEVKRKRVDWWITQLKQDKAGVLEEAKQRQVRSPQDDEVGVQLAELEQIYRLAPVGLSFVDRNLRFVRINEQLAAMNGKSVSEHIGKTIREILPELADELEPLYRSILATGQGVRERDLHGVTAAEPGVERDWLFSNSTLKTADGTVVGVASAVVEITARKQAEQQMSEYASHLEALSARLLEVQETERRHLARELHDEVGQLLTGLRLLLKSNDEVPTSEPNSRFEQARKIVDDLLAKVHGLSIDLRPAALDQLGLLPALLGLFERYTEQTGILVNFKHQGAEGRFPCAVETTAYRIVQEALTNVARHATVTGVTVRLWTSENVLHLQVEDKGRGFDPDKALAALRGNGLVGMKERTQLLGGRLEIESHAGAGTQITTELPLTN